MDEPAPKPHCVLRPSAGCDGVPYVSAVAAATKRRELFCRDCAERVDAREGWLVVGSARRVAP